MRFDIRSIDFLSHVGWIPWLEWQTILVYRNICHFLNIFISYNRFDLIVWIVDDQLLYRFMRHLAWFHRIGLVCALRVVCIVSSDEITSWAWIACRISCRVLLILILWGGCTGTRRLRLLLIVVDYLVGLEKLIFGQQLQVSWRALHGHLRLVS